MFMMQLQLLIRSNIKTIDLKNIPVFWGENVTLLSPGGREGAHGHWPGLRGPGSDSDLQNKTACRSFLI